MEHGFVVSASIKDGPKGVQLVQESFLYNADLVGYLGGKLRLNPQVSYQRTINMGYFGLGNAASGTVPANYTGPAGRYFEWIDSITNAYLQPRYTLSGPWSVTGALGYRYMAPTAYADSKLVRDAESKNPDGSPVVRGLETLSLTQVAVGMIYDSRDNEVFVHDGAYGQVGVAYQQGVPTAADIQYGEAEALIQGYGRWPVRARGARRGRPAVRPRPLLLSLHGRRVQSAGGRRRRVGRARRPGGPLLRGDQDLRERRAPDHVPHVPLPQAEVLDGRGRALRHGPVVARLLVPLPLDGSGVGLKYGVGGGLYFLWGQAAFFRVDAAYSPDAQAENPTFPLGLYVADGTMF